MIDASKVTEKMRGMKASSAIAKMANTVDITDSFNSTGPYCGMLDYRSARMSDILSPCSFAENHQREFGLPGLTDAPKAKLGMRVDGPVVCLSKKPYIPKLPDDGVLASVGSFIDVLFSEQTLSEYGGGQAYGVGRLCINFGNRGGNPDTNQLADIGITSTNMPIGAWTGAFVAEICESKPTAITKVDYCPQTYYHLEDGERIPFEFYIDAPLQGVVY